MWYPPFCKIVSVHFQGNVENIVAKTAKYFKHCRKTQNISQKIQVLGPVPSYISKIKTNTDGRLFLNAKMTITWVRYFHKPK